MLAEGAHYDPGVHADESAPVPRRLASVDAPSGTLRRRAALDGTPYCSCCDTALAPTVGRGRPPSTCPECRRTRRRLKRAAFETTRKRKRSRKPQQVGPEGQSDPSQTETAPHPAASRPRPTYEVVVREGMPNDVRHALTELTTLVDGPYKVFPAHHAATSEGQLLRHAAALVAWYKHLYKDN